MMNRFLNLDKMAFSSYGSSMTITRKQNAYMGFDFSHTVPDGYYFHPLYDAEMFYGLIFKLAFEGIDSIDIQYEFLPEVLHLFYDLNSLRLCFVDPRTIRFSGHVERGFILEYENPRRGDVAFKIDDRHVELNAYSKKAMLHVHQGTVEIDAPWSCQNARCQYIRIRLLPDNNGSLDFSFEEFDRGWFASGENADFESCIDKQREAFLSFKTRGIQCDDPYYAEALEACAYMAWSCVFQNNGYIGNHEIIVLSKNWMAMTASWDNTFNLLPYAGTDQKLAFDQIFGIFDYQEPTGALPDWITTQRFNHSFLKPPVIGAVMNVLLDDGIEFEEAYLRELCPRLERLVSFWLHYRDYDHDGIPEYGHGNDSGCDNCTVFDLAPNIEAPDLTAYIIADYDFLARCEERFGNDERAQMWRKHADTLYDKLIEHSWCKARGQFVSPISGNHQLADGDALINYMPILLGKRLSPEIRGCLVRGLRKNNRFYTRWGFASESVSSAQYDRDSYWRGPIWAPQMFFVVEGLRQCGEAEFAAEAARRYVNLCMHAGCFAENYDALNGIGLRDTSYSWASNVFQYFVKKYCC